MHSELSYFHPYAKIVAPFIHIHSDVIHPDPGIITAVLSSPKTRIADLSCSFQLACRALQEFLCEMLGLGLALPSFEQSSLLDPLLLAWLYEPQLVQRDEKEVEAYSLTCLAQRHLPQPSDKVRAPLEVWGEQRRG